MQGVRVLDLTGGGYGFSSKLLLDLGAEVIKVEPPGGDPFRHKGPYLDNLSLPDNSLSFWYSNGGKLSVILDLAVPDDCRSFKQLVTSSNLVIENYPSGCLDKLGLSFPDLEKINPAVSMVSISAFGRNGPYKNYKGSGITAAAAGGQMYVCGHAGGPPLQPFGDQSFYLASLFAAAGALLALHVCEKGGRGQHIDISSQECVAAALEHVLIQYFHDGVVPCRQGSLQWNFSSDLFPCCDGQVLLTFNREWDTLAELLKSEGMSQGINKPAFRDEDYRQHHITEIEEALASWSSQQDCHAIFELGQAMRFPWAMLNGMEDMMNNPQLVSRGYFIPARHPLADREFPAPRPVINFDAAPAFTWRKAPACGEHNGIINRILACPGQTGTKVDNKETDKKLPLEGVRVLDFTWMLAGPYATRMLADFGAEVIKVQSRLTATGAENNGSGYFAAWNRNKLGITLDLSRPDARELVMRLVEKSNVVTENFTPRVMSNWGLDYGKLRQVNPSLVMVSLSGFGHSGPWRDYAALGPTIQALSGLTSLTAYENGDKPSGIGLAYADHISGLYAVLAVLAALRRKRLNGEGAYIDISEFEAAASLVGPSMLDYALNGNVARPHGNRAPWQDAAPHGCYRCSGEDRWCVIAVSTDEEWRSLCAVMGRPEIAMQEKFSSLETRLLNHEELDVLIGKWTSRYNPVEVMGMLQQAGVPAAAVNDARDLAHDLNLKERGFFVEMVHPELGRIKADASPVRLSRNPAAYRKAAPLLGEDNSYVFMDILGMTEAEFSDHVSRGVIG